MSDADQLKAYLADRNVPCPGCGYNLRGVAEPVCPECGHSLDVHTLRVFLQHARDFMSFRRSLTRILCLHGAVVLVGTAVAALAVRPVVRDPGGLVWLGAMIALSGLVAGVMVLRVRSGTQELPFGHRAKLLLYALLPLPVLVAASAASVVAARFVGIPLHL